MLKLLVLASKHLQIILPILYETFCQTVNANRSTSTFYQTYLFRILLPKYWLEFQTQLHRVIEPAKRKLFQRRFNKRLNMMQNMTISILDLRKGFSKCLEKKEVNF